MIYITGDTHGEFRRFGKKKIKSMQLDFTEKDYVIVCGDFGMCWSKDRTFEYNCKVFKDKPFTLLWVQGNHENYDMIREFSLEEWHGGKVRHIVRDKVILLERGQIFEIEGKTFFTFGGAASHDIQGGVLDRNDPDYMKKRRRAIEKELPFRILGESWWKEEIPSEEEMQEGMINLEKNGNRVDYIITHCASTGIQNVISGFEQDILTEYFEQIEKKVEYRQWYFGHYHDNLKIDDKHTLLYTSIVPLERKEVPKAPKPGYPAYAKGDYVSFVFAEEEKIGKITVVDAYGTFGQSEEPSYDIYVEEENCLYKHFMESQIEKK